ncbi:MAG: ATPase inhibitor subunit zeta [Micropepsaceae bacterium]
MRADHAQSWAPRYNDQNLDEDTRDLVLERRNELVGLWAGHLLGKQDTSLADYARQFRMFRDSAFGDNRLVKQIMSDLTAVGHSFDEALVRVQITRFQKQAVRERLSDC